MVGLAEGAAAAAGATGGGVRDLESRPLEPVDEVDFGALEHLGTLAIDCHFDPVVILDEVLELVDLGVEEHLIGETRAPAGANTDAKSATASSSVASSSRALSTAGGVRVINRAPLTCGHYIGVEGVAEEPFPLPP